VAVLRYRLKPLNYSGEVRFENILDGNVTNIDFHISGYQLRDEKYYFIDDNYESEKLPAGGLLQIHTKTTKHAVCEAFRSEVREDGAVLSFRSETKLGKRLVNNTVRFRVQEGCEYDFTKFIAVTTSNDGIKDIRKAAKAKLDECLKKGYGRLLDEHSDEWGRLWKTADIEIEGNKRDEQAVRFNLYHVMQMGNKHNPRVNIGSRGLTSEMHYGNCFWDTELFIMPFFIYTDPSTAKALVQYRNLTLPAAREKAKKLWFEGAMFPWMSSWPGHEQADYWEYANIAVHIVSDVSYGLMHYFNATNDEAFMMQYGLEILLETSRFWKSRVDWSESRKAYCINVVKGPNEYGIVNNNTFTNWSARWNLMAGKKMAEWAKKKYPKEFAAVAKKMNFDIRETREWEKIAKGILINYDKKTGLYVEDDMFLDKHKADLKRFKPGKQISTEMGWTWDTFLRHKIVKQADVLLMMFLHHKHFTKAQLQKAWNFYEPLTLHDSSLSYNTHCILANELGYRKQAYDYFQQTVRLDLDDVMANVFLGIHSANAGGSWQCVVNGFCGMRLDDDGITFNPNLPDSWKTVSFKLVYKGHIFKVTAAKKDVCIEIETLSPAGAPVKIDGNRIIAQS
jgi:maltose phosphorylase